MDNEPKNIEQTPFEEEVLWLLQQYIYLESTALGNDKDKSLQLIQQIDKTYDKIVGGWFHEIRKTDLWLYNNLKHAHKARSGINHIFNHIKIC